ncbi:MAG: hypothetical protein MJA30_08910, partial [Cytophagales bacterium]|nr:hypothetical protein [Cytophagales bacterium]
SPRPLSIKTCLDSSSLNKDHCHTQWSWERCVLWSIKGQNHTKFSENYGRSPAKNHLNPGGHQQMNRFG